MSQMEELVSGKGDVSVVERRLTRMPRFIGQWSFFGSLEILRRATG